MEGDELREKLRGIVRERDEALRLLGFPQSRKSDPQ
jgi:hypothetical protein